jgi:tetratricopeptide (TPR) repeat protein
MREARVTTPASSEIVKAKLNNNLAKHNRRLFLQSLLLSIMMGAVPNQAEEFSSRQTPRSLISRGMQEFQSNQVEQSTESFDRAIALEPSSADYLWQRGLSLYYLDRFNDAADQFLRDVRLNPRDTEESIWRLISQARVDPGGFRAAQERMIPIEGETRPYMRAIYDVFAGRRPVAELEALAKAAADTAAAPGGLFAAAGRDAAARTGFYCELYLGLLAEAQGDAPRAREWLTRAAGGPYAVSGDYMAALARVHCLRRGWPIATGAVAQTELRR